MISILCPIYNEGKHIKRCIDSVLLQDYRQNDIELLFVDGMSTDNTREIIKSYMNLYMFIKLFDNPNKIVPSAMNIGIRASSGDLIIRIDAHAVFPSDYLSVLVKYIYELGADNVGGVCRTLPMNDSLVCRSIASVMCSKFGVGNSYFRIGARSIMSVDTVPFGCFKRFLFDKIGYFDEELVRNQDDEFNGRIIKNGGKIYLLPQLVIDYYARDSIYKVRKMFYQYGLFKPLVNKKLGKPANIRQFFPLLFVTGLFIGLPLSFFSQFILFVYVGTIFLYFILAFFFSIKETKNLKQIFMQVFTFMNVHISYGFGYLVGVYKLLTKQKFSADCNR